MPERPTSHIPEIIDAVVFFCIGACLAAWRMMGDGAGHPRHVIVFRALSNGGVSMSAGAVLVWVPDIPWLAQIGVAAFLGTIGTAGIERMLVKYLEPKKKMKSVIIGLAGIAMAIIGEINTVLRTSWPARCEQCQHRRMRLLTDGRPVMFCARAHPMTEHCAEFVAAPPRPPKGAPILPPGGCNGP